MGDLIRKIEIAKEISDRLPEEIKLPTYKIVLRYLLTSNFYERNQALDGSQSTNIRKTSLELIKKGSKISGSMGCP